MTRCTSPINDLPLSCDAFRANKGMPATELMTSTALLSHRLGLENDVQIPPIGTRTGKTSSPWINHRGVRSMHSP